MKWYHGIDKQHSCRGNSDVEQDALRFIYAYEEVLFKKHGWHVRAQYTWRMVENHGIKDAIERAVTGQPDPSGFRSLAEEGRQDISFEAIVLRHPGFFSPETRRLAQERLTAGRAELPE